MQIYRSSVYIIISLILLSCFFIIYLQFFLLYNFSASNFYTDKFALCTWELYFDYAAHNIRSTHIAPFKQTMNRVKRDN